MDLLYNQLNFVDVLVFFVINAVVFGIVIISNIAKKKSEYSKVDYILMGRSLTLPLFVATLVATWYGGIFGVTEIAFKNGVYTLISQGFFWYLAYIIFAFFMAEKVRSIEATTLPELITILFGKKSGYIAAIFNLFNVVPIAYTMSLGILLQAIFGIPFWLGCTVGTCFVCLYSMLGGFRAVVYSDLVQFFCMCFSVFLVLYISIETFGGYEYLKNNLPDHYFSIGGQEGIGTLIAWGLIALSTLVDPNFYQRCFAAKSSKIAKTGIIISTFIWFCFDCCTIFGAMYAAAYMPEAVSKSAYLTYSMTILPEGGARGFFLAGICATIMSTLDSYIFIASNTISYDLLAFLKRRPKILDKMGIVFVGVLAILLGQIFEGSVKTVWKTFGSLSAGCFLLPVVVGLWKPGIITEKCFVVSCLLSTFVIILWRNMDKSGFWVNVDELYLGVLSGLIVIVIFNISSLKSRLRV